MLNSIYHLIIQTYTYRITKQRTIGVLTYGFYIIGSSVGRPLYMTLPLLNILEIYAIRYDRNDSYLRIRRIIIIIVEFVTFYVPYFQCLCLEGTAFRCVSHLVSLDLVLDAYGELNSCYITVKEYIQHNEASCRYCKWSCTQGHQGHLELMVVLYLTTSLLFDPVGGAISW